MRHFVKHRQTEEPSVCHVHLDVLYRLPHAPDTIKALYKLYLYQHHRVYARPSVISAVPVLHKTIDKAEIYALFYQPQKMVLRYHVVHGKEHHLFPFLIGFAGHHRPFLL